MEIVDAILLCIFTFAVCACLGCIFTNNMVDKDLLKERERKYKEVYNYRKERDKYFDKYIDEVEKNKLYKLWIYEQIRDKRSD